MTFHLRSKPERIVCLTEEPTEILYLLGEQDRIVGISAYTVRPSEAAQDKPVVSAFIGGSIPKIRALEPDLVIGFSDIQADLARDLIADNQQVLIFNQRSIQEILDVIGVMGRIVGQEARAEALVKGYIERLSRAEDRTRAASVRPRVYFEEWDDPLITAIEWVGEMIEIAGGQNVFADRSRGKLASERFVTHEEILAASPEVYIGSWCGKPVDMEAVRARPGYEALPAFQDGRVHEMDPSIILQPGPALLSDGLDAMEAILRPV